MPDNASAQAAQQDDVAQAGQPDGAAQAAAQADSDQGPDDDFDKERALTTIRNLRKFEKQAKQLSQELEALKQQRADADKTELERLTSRAAEAERKALVAEGQIATAQIRAHFTERALQEGVTDLKLAYLAAQSEGLLGGYDEGEVSEHDFKALRKRYPNLFRAVGSADGGAGSGRPPTTGGMNEFIRRAAGR